MAKEYDENKLKGYPTLYAKTKSSFAGYNSLVYSKPFDDIMASFPRLPAGKKFEADNVTAQGADNPQYAADGDINTAFTAGYQSESEYPKNISDLSLTNPNQ